ncbi:MULTISPECIES: hypothetical protein [unclassified Vibrio]|uniref:hypothetical protein n=1 Tax=unclassified Vibrio TaxID=2614977 RepID=UPI003552BB85
MTKELAFLINVIASMYFMGGMLAQHEKAKELVASLDSGFLTFLKLIKDQKPLIIIHFSLKLFGVIAIGGFLGTLALGFLNVQSQQLFSIFSITLMLAGLLSGSLFWILHHKLVFKHFLKLLLLFGGGSLTMPIMDYLSGTNMTFVFATMLCELMIPLFNYVPEKGIWAETFYVSSVYGGMVIFLYALSWFCAAPTAMLACSVIALPIWGARLINKVFPTQPVVVIFLALWFYSLAYVTFV